MESKTYLVLGAGMGEAVAYILAKSVNTRLVVIGDMDIQKAVRVSHFVNMFSHSRCVRTKCIPMSFDAEETQNVELIFKQFDVVISALPAKYNLRLAEMAIKAGVHFCDLGGVVEVTNQMMELNQQHPDMSVSVIPDNGLMPGLGLMELQKLLWECKAQSLRPDSAIIYVGGIPQKPEPPVYYQPMFSIEGLAHLCFDKAPVLKNGEIVLVDPFSEYEQIYVPELVPYSKQFNGTVEAFITSGASVAPWYLQKLGLKNFCEKTIRLPGFAEFAKPLTLDNFEEKIKATIRAPIDKNNPDLVWMTVKVSGESYGTTWSKRVTLLDLFDKKTGLTAMQRTTGFSTAVVAEMMAEGKTRHGVNTPENAFDHSGINEVLDRVGRFITFR